MWETNEFGFYEIDGKPIEGFLGDEEKADILFVLREPNTNGKLTKSFWFKNAAFDIGYDECDAKDKRARTKYKKVLGKFATGFEKEIKNCAYINLYPFSGEGSKSKLYKNALKELQDKSINKEYQCQVVKDYKELIDNRLEVIKKCGCKNVVTTSDIFYALKRYYEKDKGIEKDFNGTYKYKNDRVFNSFKFEGINYIEFYHPSYSIDYDALRKMLDDYKQQNGVD